MTTEKCSHVQNVPPIWVHQVPHALGPVQSRPLLQPPLMRPSSLRSPPPCLRVQHRANRKHRVDYEAHQLSHR